MTEFHDAGEATREEPATYARDPWEEAWPDWWTTDRVDAVGWAALFMWGALVVLATYTDFQEGFSWWDGWGVFWIGAGVILLVETLARLFMPAYRSKWWWTLLWGVGLLSLGLGALFGWAWLSLFLVAVAIVILKGAFARTS